MIITIVAGLLLALLIYSILLYNNLISLKNNVSKNWSNIEILLKQRYSELPKLIDTCKAYMQYERDTLEKVVEARQNALSATTSRDIAALSKAETSLTTSLGQLFALAENYPELKTNEAFQKVQNRISALETEIADRREFYNESVNISNIRIHQFPDLIIANLFKFNAFELMKFKETELQDVDVQGRF